jgi:hypothetical protein
VRRHRVQDCFQDSVSEALALASGNSTPSTTGLEPRLQNSLRVENTYGNKGVNLEQRRMLRYRMVLPLHILELDGERVNWAVRTRDISLGGVSFLTQKELKLGSAVVYLITLSTGNPPVQIRCVGKVLRCEKTDGRRCEVAFGMERYTFVRQEKVELELAAVSPPSETEAFGELRRPALARSTTG